MDQKWKIISQCWYPKTYFTLYISFVALKKTVQETVWYVGLKWTNWDAATEKGNPIKSKSDRHKLFSICGLKFWQLLIDEHWARPMPNRMHQLEWAVREREWHQRPLARAALSAASYETPFRSVSKFSFYWRDPTHTHTHYRVCQYRFHGPKMINWRFTQPHSFAISATYWRTALIDRT